MKHQMQRDFEMAIEWHLTESQYTSVFHIEQEWYCYLGQSKAILTTTQNHRRYILYWRDELRIGDSDFSLDKHPWLDPLPKQRWQA